MIFYIVITFVVIQRLIELSIAKKNEKWMLSQGAVETGKEHYKFIVILHTLFIISMIVEYNLKSRYIELNFINYLFLVFFIILQAGRVWVISSLGKYWNTRILRIPGSELIRTGPYRFFRHPNYIIVICEIFTVPLIFNLYYTAAIFTILNLLILRIRIKTENNVLNNQLNH
ncbi:MAG TPA: isoprenylcysteine carboxylmethyltransferase family protein [Ignavibacteria bacterium]|nr:isoprenylcysteine carboxylmethyltransferase family protein [Ignavibacteria bacterium]